MSKEWYSRFFILSKDQYQDILNHLESTQHVCGDVLCSLFQKKSKFDESGKLDYCWFHTTENEYKMLLEEVKQMNNPVILNRLTVGQESHYTSREEYQNRRELHHNS